MQINKSVSCKKLEELIELIKKIDKKTNISSFNFNGNKDKESRNENYSINWFEDEEL